MKRLVLAGALVFSLVRIRSHTRGSWTRAMCWWAGHEPKPMTFKTATSEYGTCKHCGIEISRAVVSDDVAVAA